MDLREYGKNKKVYMERYGGRAKKQNGEERSKKVEGGESGSGLSMSSGAGIATDRSTQTPLVCTSK